jgi:hypothetical protein
MILLLQNFSSKTSFPTKISGGFVFHLQNESPVPGFIKLNFIGKVGIDFFEQEKRHQALLILKELRFNKTRI